MILEEVTDEVLEAFKEHNLKPVKSIWICTEDDTKQCACAIGGLMTKRAGFDAIYDSYYNDETDWSLFHKTQMDVFTELNETYGKDFAEGLIAGFDGVDIRDPDYNFWGYDIESYSNGYDTGKYIWNKLNQVMSQ